jgi:hypothetical protein
MNLLVWLDISLIVFALFAMSPWLWNALRRRRTAHGSTPCRGMRMRASLPFYLGVAMLCSAGIDVGLAEWQQARHSINRVDIRESMMAPDFRLPSLGEERTVRLSDYRGHKPVVLIFGNFY